MERDVTSFLNVSLLKIVVWFLNGALAAFLLLATVKFGLAVYAPLHPTVEPEARTERVTTRSTPVNYTKVKNLTLVSKNEPKKQSTSETDSEDALKDVDLQSVKKIEESTLPLEVVGIAYGPVGFRMVSLRNLKTRTVKTLTAGASWSGAVIREINRTDVVITNKKTGEAEVLPLERGGDGEGISIGSGTEEDVMSVSRYQVNQAIQSNMDKLLTKVKVVPHFRRGKIIGFKISRFRGRPGKLLKKLGFRPGDVITRVNGKRINEMSQALKLWSSLRYQKDFDIRILRDGKKMNLKYELTR